MAKLLKTKQPSPTLPYLIMSNVLSVAYLWRLHNGDVINQESNSKSEGGKLEFSISESITQVILHQLLSQEAQ